MTRLRSLWRRYDGGREEMGKSCYTEARELFITADAGGSNGHRSRAWKHELQQFADETRVLIHVSHFTPTTSKWNVERD